MNDSSNLSELALKTEQTRIQFLQSDLASCLGFLEQLKTEFRKGNRKAGRRLLLRAEGKYSLILEFSRHVADSDRHDEVHRKLNKLRKSLDRVTLVVSEPISMKKYFADLLTQLGPRFES